MKALLARFLGPILRAAWADRRGSIAVYTAFAAVGLMGFAGLAIDAASWEVTKRQMQGAADQAAIGAVVAYLAGGGDNATTQADAIVASYGFASPNATVTVTPVTPSPTGYDAAYSVTITQLAQQYFSKLFISAPTVGATAEAATISDGPCVLALNGGAGTGVDVSGAGTLNLTNCDMDVNSTSSNDAVDSGGAGIFAQNINVDGGTNPIPSTGTVYTAGKITYSGKYKSGTVTADPYANRTKPSVGTCGLPSPGAANNTNYNPVASGPQNFPSATYSGNFTINTGTTATFSAGSIFTQGIKINGGTVTFATGNYTFQQGITLNGGNVTLSPGTYSGGISISGSGSVPTVTFSAGNYCGFKNTQISGGTVTLNPGTYDGGIGNISNSANVTLNAGVYVMNGGNEGFQVSGSAPPNVVTGTGVTIFLTAPGNGQCGKFEVNGGQSISITAPTSGETAGIAVWIDSTTANCPANTQVTFSGSSSASVTGAIYAPANQVTYSGGSSGGTGCTQIVSNTLVISGPSYFQHNCSGTGVSDPTSSTRVALIQ